MCTCFKMSNARLSSFFLRVLNTQRHYSATKAAQTSPLAILRRKTGYPFSKCKEALTKHNNDVKIAEQYLRDQAQKEGWAKAEKVRGRAANHGLVGVAIDGNKGLMIEVGGCVLRVIHLIPHDIYVTSGYIRVIHLIYVTSGYQLIR